MTMAVLLTVITNRTLCVLIIDHYHDWLAFKVWGFIIGSAVERQACTLQSCNLLSKILQEMRQVHPPQSAVKRPS